MDGLTGITFGEFTDGISDGGLNGETSKVVGLPAANFKLPTDGSVRKALLICTCKLKLSGYPNSANATFLIAGDDNSTGNNSGYIGARFNASSASAALAAIQVNVLGVAITDNAAAALITGDAPQQIAALYESDGSTFQKVSVYIDRVFSNSFSEAYSVESGSDDIRLFSSGVFNVDAGTNGGQKIYRYTVANLTDRLDLDVEDFLQAESNAVTPYIS